MEVILTQDYPALGYVGDRVAVRRGYARNFLLPRGIAVETASHNARLLAHKMAGINAHKAKLRAQADEIAGRLSQVRLEFVMKLGALGKSFGAVTLRDVELALEGKGFKFDRRQVKLAEAIKSAGEFEAQVKLHSEVSVSVPIKVTAEIAAPVAAEGAPSEGAQKPRGRRSRRTRDGESASQDERSTEQSGSSEAASTEGES